jgi:hypothetical protein
MQISFLLLLRVLLLGPAVLVAAVFFVAGIEAVVQLSIITMRVLA